MKAFQILAAWLIPALALGQGPSPTKIFLQEEKITDWIHLPSAQAASNRTSCKATPKYPLEVKHAVAQVVDGSVTVCGGATEEGSWSATAECFRLDAAKNKWMEFPAMDTQREWAASVVTPYGWLVTGGRGSSSHLSSMSLWNGQVWRASSDLPGARRGHCMVQVNSSHTFISGGSFPGFSYDDAYLYELGSDRWKRLPNMTWPLYEHACGYYRDANGRDFIITAGGHGRYPDGVQSLDLTNPVSWTELPELPRPYSSTGGTFINDGDDLVLVHWESNSLLRFDKSDGTFLVDASQTWDQFEDHTLAVAVTDGQLSGCKLSSAGSAVESISVLTLALGLVMSIALLERE